MKYKGKIRIWFEFSGSQPVFHCDWAACGAQHVTATFSNLANLGWWRAILRNE